MNFDVAMPLTLFAVTTITLFLDKKVKSKLRSAFEEREFRVQEAVLLVATMIVMVSLIVFIPLMAVMIMFLFAYSMLLFVFAYLFSDFQKSKARVFYMAFLIASFLAAAFSLANIGADKVFAYGVLAFSSIFGFSFLALLYEEDRVSEGERWYVAILPPALFICLYAFFSGTHIWFPYLLDLYGAIFAVLIILYLGSLFTWKTTLIFVCLATIVDIILVWFTGSMVSAVTHVSSLRLPVLIALPTIPTIVSEGSRVYMSLALGDFFFSGLLALQTMKKYGKSFAVLSIIAMSTSFFISEAFMLNYKYTASPGTLMIIWGWAVLLLLKILWDILHRSSAKT